MNNKTALFDASEAQRKALGERLRQARLAAGVTQTALGRAIGCSYQMIWKYERGVNRIPSDTLQRLAAHLSTPVADLMGEDPQSPEAAGYGRLRLEAAALINALPIETIRALVTLLRTIPTPTTQENSEC